MNCDAANEAGGGDGGWGRKASMQKTERSDQWEEEEEDLYFEMEFPVINRSARQPQGHPTAFKQKTHEKSNH